MGKDYPDSPSGTEALSIGLRNIANCLRSNGLLCVVEFDHEYELESYLVESGYRVLTRDQIQSREIRSRGRTDVVSTLTMYLCQKVM